MQVTMSIKEGGSMTRPPLLEGINYAYKKVRTKIFIQSIDYSAQDAVENEQTPSTKKVEDAMTRMTKEVVKQRSEWDDVVWSG